MREVPQCISPLRNVPDVSTTARQANSIPSEFLRLLCGFGCRGVEEEFRCRILPDMEVHGVLSVPLLGREARFVALGAWTPHGGAFRTVEHPELDGREVGDAS